jgi:rubrerythrin
MSKPRQTLGISKLRRAELLGGTYVSLIGQHEAMVKCLYETFAIAFPNMKKFWIHLSREEEQHFRLIKALEGDIRNSDIVFKRPVFTQSQVKDSIAWICARKMRVEKGGISVNDALAMCIQIEQGMVEHRFFDIMDDDDENVRQVLAQLEKSSIVHLRRARKEAARLKWKMFGKRRNKPIPENERISEPVNSCEDPKAAVKLAQAAILASLINMEKAAGSLYNAYAQLLPETASLWSQLAADEMTHSRMLHSLEEMLDKGATFQHVGHFGVTNIKQEIDLLRNAETKARRDGISYSDAMIMALRTETFMAECEFYKTVESDAPEFKYIAERLVDLTQEHIKRLQEGAVPMAAEVAAKKKEEAAEKWGGVAD